MRTEQHPCRPTGFGSELQPAAFGQAQPVDLGECPGDGPAAQHLFQRPQTVRTRPDPDHDEPLGREAQAGASGRIKIPARPDPDHRPVRGEAAEQHRAETGRCLTRATQLMDRTAGEPAGQHPVDRLQPERQARARRVHDVPAELAAQMLEDPLPVTGRERLGHDRHMFLF